ncbi:hypothetical protein A6F68_01417 [Tsuneonella dongtanensis]|uniref:YrhK domain-containing protein n=1 Tax=Tsuneonella dongtanensis TaxID=692370 RepID=A0A1B2ACQ7_9SPHN|nr:hypothetical protein [Tsuneonella dongtanensis]ANY19933.1 hypothetical protein A6F68_01417 [Tsuneonella dongtanensis]
MASRPPEFTPTPPTDRERQRFVVLNAMRFVGFALVLFGILLTQGAVSVAGDLDQFLGYFFIVIGLFDGFFMPLIMAHKWRTPSE